MVRLKSVRVCTDSRRLEHVLVGARQLAPKSAVLDESVNSRALALLAIRRMRSFTGSGRVLRQMSRPQQSARHCLVLATTFIAGCGGGTPTSSSPATPERVTLSGTVPVFSTAVQPLTAGRSGTAMVGLSWADPSVDLDLYVTDKSCTAYPPLRCTILASSTSRTGSSETVMYPVTLGVQLQLWVDNLSLSSAQPYTIVSSID